jgi:hypothetical protein
MATIKMDDSIDSDGEVSSTKKKSNLDADNVTVSVFLMTCAMFSTAPLFGGMFVSLDRKK